MNLPRSLPERSLRLRCEEEAVNEARQLAEQAINGCNFECRQATGMAAWELAENLVKYGSGGKSQSAGTIAISVDEYVVRLRTTNTVDSRADAERVMEAVTMIATTPDTENLYRARMLELFSSPDQSRAELGLLRIAFEGGFRLSCSFTPPLLEIVAERACGEA